MKNRLYVHSGNYGLFIYEKGYKKYALHIFCQIPAVERMHIEFLYTKFATIK